MLQSESSLTCVDDLLMGLPRVEKVQKRQSNVLKLVEENEKLKAELKAMTDRLEAAERRKKELKSLEERST